MFKPLWLIGLFTEMEIIWRWTGLVEKNADNEEFNYGHVKFERTNTV